MAADCPLSFRPRDPRRFSRSHSVDPASDALRPRRKKLAVPHHREPGASTGKPTSAQSQAHRLYADDLPCRSGCTTAMAEASLACRARRSARDWSTGPPRRWKSRNLRRHLREISRSCLASRGVSIPPKPRPNAHQTGRTDRVIDGSQMSPEVSLELRGQDSDQRRAV